MHANSAITVNSRSQAWLNLTLLGDTVHRQEMALLLEKVAEEKNPGLAVAVLLRAPPPGLIHPGISSH